MFFLSGEINNKGFWIKNLCYNRLPPLEVIDTLSSTMWRRSASGDTSVSDQTVNNGSNRHAKFD